ncbi:hypothetical protein quinque_008240 [Culex quinquefasciatus]
MDLSDRDTDGDLPESGLGLADCAFGVLPATDTSVIKDKEVVGQGSFSSSPAGRPGVAAEDPPSAQVETKSLKIRGLTSVYPLDKWKTPTLTANMLAQINKRCPGLEHFEIIEGYMDTNNMAIISFPQSIKTLIDRTLQKLEELTIEYCSWFDTHDFMALSKVPHLRYLSLKGCANMKDSVPYASIATRFGFRSWR